MINIKDLLFWIFLIISIVLLLWVIFGNSPTEFIAIITLIFTLLIKIWSISDRQIKLEMRFLALAKDFKEHINQNKK